MDQCPPFLPKNTLPTPAQKKVSAVKPLVKQVFKALDPWLSTATPCDGKQPSTTPTSQTRHPSPSEPKPAKPLPSLSWVRVAVLPQGTATAREQAAAFAKVLQSCDLSCSCRWGKCCEQWSHWDTIQIQPTDHPLAIPGMQSKIIKPKRPKQKLQSTSTDSNQRQCERTATMAHPTPCSFTQYSAWEQI